MGWPQLVMFFSGCAASRESLTVFDTKLISRFKKERYLRELSEDDFRDAVIRPLFLRLGFRDGRDLCGPTEAGKDAIFVENNRFGSLEVVALQTKRGNLNLAATASQNLVSACTQLLTALSCRVPLLGSRQSIVPHKAILCASGKINESARAYIADQIPSPNVTIFGVDELIPLIDENIPEVWLGIKVELIPYFTAIKRMVEDTSVIGSASSASAGSGVFVVSAGDTRFISLNLYRHVVKIRSLQRGRKERYTDIEEFPLQSILGKRHRRVLIVGDAGSGKSTGLLRVAYQLARQGIAEGNVYRVPVFIRAHDIISSGATSFPEYCMEATKRLTGREDACFNTQDLVSGRVVVLLDSLDELPSNEARERLLSMADDLLLAYPKVQIIATSRPYAFTNKLGKLAQYVEYKISPMSWRQADRILHSVKSSERLPVAQSHELLRKLERVHGMELTPLLVTVFAATTQYTKQDIPANITELFKKFTELMLGRWDESKGLELQYQAQVKDFVLTKLAYAMHVGKRTRISRAQADVMVREELVRRGHEANASALLREIFERSGLFRIHDDEVEFRHHLLQEFFAGRGIESVDQAKSFVTDDWWKHALIFFFGENPQKVELLHELAQSARIESPVEAVVSATTVGLALQACYLSPVVQKLDVWKWVVSTLISRRDAYIEAIGHNEDRKLLDFVNYYLYTRDSIALSNLQGALGDLIPWCTVAGHGLEDAEADVRMFWLAVGLIEAGDMAAARDALKNFRPDDPRLLLAIHLGCFLTARIRPVAKNDRDIAQAMVETMDPHVARLRKELIREFDSVLLEMRDGKAMAIDHEALAADNT